MMLARNVRDLGSIPRRSQNSIQRSSLLHLYEKEFQQNIFSIQLKQAYFALLRKDLLEPRNSSVIKAYEQYAIDVAVLLGADEATAEADMKAMVDWEIDMAQVRGQELCEPVTFCGWSTTVLGYLKSNNYLKSLIPFF